MKNARTERVMEGKGSREEATERKKDQENSLREKAPTQFPEDHGNVTM